MAHISAPATRYVPSHNQRGVVARLLALLSLDAERHSLRSLDDHLLDDIGVSRSAAEKEANRPFWDVPANWKG